MQTPTLLLVDDDALSLSLVAGMLGSCLPNALLFTSDSAESALAISGSHNVDCALIDYDMPGTNGIVLAQLLRGRQPYLPIILCTGAGDERLAVEALKSGVTDYLPKALISAKALHRAIDNAIELAARARIIDEQRADLETFAFALAHDFRQPIRQIVTFSELIGREFDGHQSERVAKMLGFMTSAANRLDRLVEVVMQCALTTAAPELAPITISDVMREVTETIHAYIAERGGTLRLEGDAVVRGERALLTQVLYNLVVNGLKFNRSARPEVIVSVDTHGDDGQVTIRVRDNGIGIDTAYQAFIFQPLARVHTREEYEGSGMGLTLVHKALRAQGGTIRCEGAANAGSTFVVRLAQAGADAASIEGMRAQPVTLFT